MDTEPDIDLVYVPEMARIFETTESAIRTRLRRGVGVPARYAESSKACWLRNDVTKYLEDLVKIQPGLEM